MFYMQKTQPQQPQSMSDRRGNAEGSDLMYKHWEVLLVVGVSRVLLFLLFFGFWRVAAETEI